MNHKRKRPKHRRAGCLMCKPHKDERTTKEAKPSIEAQAQLSEDEKNAGIHEYDQDHDCGFYGCAGKAFLPPNSCSECGGRGFVDPGDPQHTPDNCELWYDGCHCLARDCTSCR